MVFNTIQNPKVSTGTTFGGDVLNKLQQWFGGVDIAASDSTNKPSINTETRFYSGKFILWDYDFSNQITFFTPNLSTNVSVSFPLSLSNAYVNEITFNLASQTLTNKIIDASVNALTNITNTSISSVANIAWTKISKAGSGLGDLETVNLTGLSNGDSIKWDTTTAKWILWSPAATTGEINTASNIGDAGIGLFKQKTALNLEFKNISSGSSSVTVVNDTVHNEVDIDVIDASTTAKGKVQLGTSSDTAAGLAVQASDTRLTNTRTPSTHATSHKSGGSDLIKINELGAGTSNITTTNTTVSANGTAPMLPNDVALYLNGTGGWSAPPGTGSGVSGNGSIIRGTTQKSGNGSTKVFTIAHTMAATPTGYFVEANSTDAFGSFTRTVDATNITLTYQVAPPTGTNNLTFTWVVMDSGTGSTSGEANTYSTVGTGLVLTKTKVGIDLVFRSLFAGSTKISMTQNTNDISFDVNQANLSIAWSQLTSVPTNFVKNDQANTFGDFLQTIRSSQLKIMNPANTFGTIIANSAIVTSDKTLNLPLLTGTDTVVVLALAQTLTNKTLTNPIISTISNTGTITLPTATTTLIGTNTTDTLTNKTLTAPIISAISNTGTVTLPTATTTLIGTGTTDTLTNKTINATNNTITDTSAAAGDLLVYNGTRFARQAKGSDGTFLGISGGSVGYFTPATGSGGLLPDGSAIPVSGRWGAVWGGSLTGRGVFDVTVVSDVTNYRIISPTESATDIQTPASDDDIAEFKTTLMFSRQSNLVVRMKWALNQTTNTVIMAGLASIIDLPTGGNHDTPLDTASGIMVTCSQDIESVYQISRNDGGSTQVKAATTVAANTVAVHTLEINLNTTNAIVTLDGGTPVTYTTRIPALTTPLAVFLHVEAIGGTAKAVSMRRMQITML